MSIFVRVHVCFKDEGDGDGDGKDDDDDYDDDDDDGDGEIMIIMVVMMGTWSGCQGDSSKIVVGYTCK